MALETLIENCSSSAILGLLILLLMLYLFNRRPSGIPPLPVTPLPIIGNLLSMEKDNGNKFAKWRKEFGDIFSIYMGSKLVVVLNGFECVKEAFVKNGDMFSDRPNFILFTHALRSRGIGATSGAEWKSQRTLALTALRDYGFGKNSMEGKIHEEVEFVVNYFASKNSRKENFDYIFKISTSNILCSILFRRRFEYDDSMFIKCCKALDTLMVLSSNTGLGNFLPFLQYLPGDFANIKSLKRSVECFHELLIDPEIERHFKEYDGTTNDFISAYIKEIKDREAAGKDVTELRKNFTQTVSDLFIGGTETTATTLKWLILFLIHFPEVQEKCFHEIRDKIGLSRLPELKDKALLSYVQATFAETQRYGNIAPLGVIHAVAEDTTFRGFNIPKGTAVISNLGSVLMDPEVWPNPNEFRPERFLDKEGNFFKPKEFIPFSIGRRVCLGESLAKMEVFLFGTALMQRFCFQQPEDEPWPSLKPVITTVAVPMPYKVKAVPRD